MELHPDWQAILTALLSSGGLTALFGSKTEIGRIAHVVNNRWLLPFEERTKTKVAEVRATEEAKRLAALTERSAFAVPELPSDGGHRADFALQEDDRLLGLAERADARGTAERVWRQRNLESVFARTFTVPPPASAVPDEAPSATFLTRFVEYASTAEDDAVQALWAKLLAAEIVKPGRFSLRTLNVISNMTSAEARLFRRACECSTDDGLLLYQHTGMEEAIGLSSDDLLLLGEAGLVILNLSAIVSLVEMADGRFSAAVGYFDKTIVYAGGRENFGAREARWEVPVHGFTRAGLELRQLVPQAADPLVLAAIRSQNKPPWTVTIEDRPLDPSRSRTKTRPGDFWLG